MRYAGFPCTVGVLLAASLAVSGIASAQQGRIYVIESTVTSIEAGKEYALSDRLTIPAGGTIRAVMPSGKTQTIRGPHSGPLSDLAKGQNMNERVFSWIKSFFETGGAQEKTIGAARSAAPPPPPPPAFSWTAVPIDHDGDVCVIKGRPLQLVRAHTKSAGRITVVDVEKAGKGDARWAKGGWTTAWPSSVAVRPDGTFTLLVPDEPAREVTLRVLDRVPGADDTLNALAARGCKEQFDAWMRQQMKGKAS